MSVYMTRYVCEEPPCLHVVVDYSGKKLAVFLETGDGDIVYVPLEKLLRACERAKELLASRFREAKGREIDELAYEKLDALPLEED